VLAYEKTRSNNNKRNIAVIKYYQITQSLFFKYKKKRNLSVPIIKITNTIYGCKPTYTEVLH